MDNLICDPELASQLFRVVNDKLQETRVELEQTKRENDALRAEVTRLQDMQIKTTAADPESEDPESTRRHLQGVLEDNQRLRGEIADLHGLLEGCRSPGGADDGPRVDGGKGGTKCSQSGCQARQDASGIGEALAQATAQLEQHVMAYNEIQERVTELQREIERSGETSQGHKRCVKELQSRLVDKKADYSALQQRYEELQKQVATRDDDARQLRQQLDEQQQQHATKQSEFVKNDYKLRQELELMTSKYWRYKAAFEQTNARPATSVPSAPPEPEPAILPPSAPPPSTRLEQLHPEPTNQGAATAGLTIPNQPWFAIVDYVLRNPCLPLSEPSAPFHLPPHVREHLPPGLMLSCPNRIIYPYAEGFARFVAPQVRCKGSSTPTEFGPPTNELAKLVGMRKEVFYHSDTGISYAGTFLCTDVGEISREEYRDFPRFMKEALVRHTFPNKTELAAAEKADLDRIRNFYLTGRLKTQYLSLRFLGYSKPLEDALKGLGAMDAAAQRETAGAKRQSGSVEDDVTRRSNAKRAKTVAYL